MIFEIVHQMALLPFLWLAWLHFRGERRDVAWWWLAGAFFVSWLADTAAHWMAPFLVSPVYLVSQASIIGFVFLSRRKALTLIVVLVAVGIAAILWRGVDSPDVLFHTVAWLSVVGIVYPLRQLGRLRYSLLIYYGAGWLCWLGYAINPGWFSWSGYQLTRLLGIAMFCWAASSPLPHLKLSRG